MSTGTNKERLTQNNGIINENNTDLNALKTKINNLPTSGDTTATANDIALGKTAVSKGVKITGTYTPPTVSLQSKDVTINQNGTTTITADQGYDGLSDVDVTVSGILDTSDATATANDIAKNKTAYVNGVKLTGTYAGGLDIYIQTTAPIEYNGLWIKSNTYTYSNVKEVANKSSVEASTINIATGNTYETKFSDGNLTYNFNKVYITDSNNDILYDTKVYYGDGTQWVDITPLDPSLKFAGIRVDFANGTIEELEGSVPVDELNCYSNRRRCNMQNDGTITAYYGDENYDNVGLENLQVMVEQPKVYYSLQNVVVNNGAIDKADYIVADTKINDEFELHPAFISNGVEYDKVYAGAFEATVVNNKLSSIGGGTTTPQTNLTRAQARDYASNRGNAWRQLTKQYKDLESLLITIEYKSFDHQNALAYGVSSSGSKQPVGQIYTLNAKGTGFKGATKATSDCFTWRWRENVYGNITKFIDGININGDTCYIKDNNFQDDTSTGYTQLSETTVLAHGGTVARFAYVPEAKWIFLPKAVDINSIITDIIYTSSGWNIVCDWGWYNNGGKGGSFSKDGGSSTRTDNAIGCVLLAMPLPQNNS